MRPFLDRPRGIRLKSDFLAECSGLLVFGDGFLGNLYNEKTIRYCNYMPHFRCAGSGQRCGRNAGCGYVAPLGAADEDPFPGTL